jgi:hypothetical protein
MSVTGSSATTSAMGASSGRQRQNKRKGRSKRTRPAVVSKVKIAQSVRFVPSLSESLIGVFSSTSGIGCCAPPGR